MKIKNYLKKRLFLYHIYMKYKDRLRSKPLKLIGEGIIAFRLKRNIGLDNIMSIGKGCWADKLKISIHGNNNSISIGDKVKFKFDCELFIRGNNCSIEIGDGTSFSSGLRIMAVEDNSYVKIGKECMFSNQIMVRTDDSHYIYDIQTGERINKAKPIVVGDHVWIAAGVTILKGTIIGKGSVIGTKSLVTHDISENCIAAGIPAKVVRENVVWSSQEKE